MNNTETLAVMEETADVFMSQQPLHEVVRQILHTYFAGLDTGVPPAKLYKMVIEQVEPPLIELMLKYTKGNQCKAAEFLGISRSTLLKKIKVYGLE